MDNQHKTAVEPMISDAWLDHFDNKSSGRRVSSFGDKIYVQDVIDGIEYWCRPLSPEPISGAKYQTWDYGDDKSKHTIGTVR